MTGTDLLEIERKYRLREAPSAEVLAAHGAVAKRIEQVYLAGVPANRRLRRTELPGGEVRLVVTEKRRVADFTFHERERVIDEREYERLLGEADPAKGPVRKIRHLVPHGSQALEIDVFESPAGLVLLEVELRSTDEAVTLPPWLGDWREVTGDGFYLNANLARRGVEIPPY